ncbi:MAG TPA: ComEA family DNA-binding protein [Leptolyngbyaceae cyanobacterium M65_K2018_010]|nr:ComEA family DNA-binding protein [Leptolyngbyaceae cyanobacterium M65_K2018_010]
MAGLSKLKQGWQTLRAQLHPLASRLAEDPGYRLRSLAEVDRAADLGFRLDVNQATVDDWLRLPGISIRQAQVLTQLRQSGLQFYALEDIAAALGVPPSQLQPLAKVLAFCYYDRGNPWQLQRVNLNQANAAQLCQVPAISPALAQGIIAERHWRGPFQHLGDFQRRLQLSAEIMATLMHHLQC